MKSNTLLSISNIQNFGEIILPQLTPSCWIEQSILENHPFVGDGVAILGVQPAPSQSNRCPPGNGAAHPSKMGEAPKAQRMDGYTLGGLQQPTGGSWCLSHPAWMDGPIPGGPAPAGLGGP